MGGQPDPKDSSTQFTTSPSLSNITEWKKSTAPGMSPVPPELTSSSPTIIGLSVSGIPVLGSISHTWPCSAQAPPARLCSMWTTMSWQAIAAGSKGGLGRPFSPHSILPSGSPGYVIRGEAISVVAAGLLSGTEMTWITPWSGPVGGSSSNGLAVFANSVSPQVGPAPSGYDEM